MARRPAEGPSGRIAILGAPSPAGALLKAALAGAGMPGDRVDLFGWTSEVAVLSEYDGEARLVQPVGELQADRRAAVFVCEPGHADGPLLAAARSGALVVDMTGTLPGTTLADAEAVRDGARLVAIPHPVAAILAAMLSPLHAAIGLVRASAFVLRPAGDFGPPGLDELREQTIRLLRFESVPTEVFGRQLAFNVVPEHLFPQGEESLSSRIAAECRALADVPDATISVTLALAPTFLGHAIALHADVARGGRAEAAAALSAAPGVVVAEGLEAGTTMDAPDDVGVQVARIDDAGLGSLRIWAVAADAGAAVAARAVEAAIAARVV